MAHARPPAAFAPAFLIACLLALGACQRKIGDACRRDLDCSQMRDRICDTTQSDGYCTQFNCSPTSCPKGESICVAFNNTPSTVPRCSNPGRTSPYVRNFCMGICTQDSDCRSGYVCIDMSEENDWGASIIQLNPIRTGVCISPESAETIGPDRQNQVCTGAGGAGEGEGGGGGGGAQNNP